MIDSTSLFRDVWAWSLNNAEPWHNWVAHGLIAAILGILIGVIAKAFGVPFGVGPWTAASYYVLREGEELMLAWAFPGSIDWKDHALDAGVPVVCSVIVYLVSLLVRVRIVPPRRSGWRGPPATQKASPKSALLHDRGMTRRASNNPGHRGER